MAKETKKKTSTKKTSSKKNTKKTNTTKKTTTKKVIKQEVENKVVEEPKVVNTKKKISKSKIILLLLLLIGVTLGIVYSTSYALWKYSVSQTNTNAFTTDCFEITYTDRNNIKLDYAFPLTDNQADEELTPYSFTITNTCDHGAKVDINLETLSTTTLDTSNIRVEFNEESKYNYNTGTSTTPTITGAQSAIKLGTKKIAGKQSETYTLKLWLKEDAVQGNVENKRFDSKVTIKNTLATKVRQITLHANNLTLTNNKTSVEDGATLGTLPTINIPGVNVLGWYSDSNLTNQVTVNTTVTSSLTDLYAKYSYSLTPYLRNIEGTDVVQDDLSGDANMRFVGANPNNYILFGCQDETNPTLATCELWRIIGVFDSNTHNNSNDLVKVVKATSLGNMDYNTSAYSSWHEASLNTTLNSSTYPYATSTLAQSVTIKTGATSYDAAIASGGAKALYDTERSNSATAYAAYQTSSTGVVAIPYMSDFLFATSGTTGEATRDYCINTAQTVASINTYWKTNPTLESNGYCSRSSWLVDYAVSNTTNVWSLSACAKNTYSSYIVYPNNSTGLLSNHTCSNQYAIYPTVYLKTNVICQNCASANVGTSANPYIVTAS